jgi:peptide/nickel transport system substrate-binding protein
MGVSARMRAWLALVAICGALVAAGCSSNDSSAYSLNDKATVNFLIESSPTNLDPRIGTDAQSEHLHGLIFDSLLARDARMNIVPDLAERWEMPDALTYVFHLRRGVKFHDGRPFTSADVKFTFDSILSGTVKTPKRGAFELVRSIETPDVDTVVFHLSEPYASFLWDLTRPGIGIVPKDSDNNGGDNHTNNVADRPIGTGPFKFVSKEQDEEIVLERNSDYFGGAPKIERVRFRIVPDAIVRALELRKGTADLELSSLGPDTVVTLGKQPGLVADAQPGTNIAYVAFNFDDPTLAHREVRQALAYATDRESLIKYLLRGQARAASSLLPPDHWAYEPNVQQYGYDPERARQLLDAAGFHAGRDGMRLHLTLKTSTDESTRILAEALADQWKQVGIALELRPLEFATFYSDITHGSFQLYTFRWVGANNDPDMFEYVFDSKKMPPAGANRGHYKSPELDRLLEQQRVEMDSGKRKVILSEIQKIVAVDEPYINLWYTDNVCVHRTRIAGITIPPSGDFSLLNSASLQ